MKDTQAESTSRKRLLEILPVTLGLAFVWWLLGNEEPSAHMPKALEGPPSAVQSPRLLAQNEAPSRVAEVTRETVPELQLAAPHPFALGQPSNRTITLTVQEPSEAEVVKPHEITGEMAVHYEREGFVASDGATVRWVTFDRLMQQFESIPEGQGPLVRALSTETFKPVLDLLPQLSIGLTDPAGSVDLPAGEGKLLVSCSKGDWLGEAIIDPLDPDSQLVSMTRRVDIEMRVVWPDGRPSVGCTITPTELKHVPWSDWVSATDGDGREWLGIPWESPADRVEFRLSVGQDQLEVTHTLGIPDLKLGLVTLSLPQGPPGAVHLSLQDSEGRPLPTPLRVSMGTGSSQRSPDYWEGTTAVWTNVPLNQPLSFSSRNAGLSLQRRIPKLTAEEPVWRGAWRMDPWSRWVAVRLVSSDGAVVCNAAVLTWVQGGLPGGGEPRAGDFTDRSGRVLIQVPGDGSPAGRRLWIRTYRLYHSIDSDPALGGRAASLTLSAGHTGIEDVGTVTLSAPGVLCAGMLKVPPGTGRDVELKARVEIDGWQPDVRLDHHRVDGTHFAFRIIGPVGGDLPAGGAFDLTLSSVGGVSPFGPGFQVEQLNVPPGTTGLTLIADGLPEAPDAIDWAIDVHTDPPLHPLLYRFTVNGSPLSNEVGGDHTYLSIASHLGPAAVLRFQPASGPEQHVEVRCPVTDRLLASRTVHVPRDPERDDGSEWQLPPLPTREVTIHCLMDGEPCGDVFLRTADSHWMPLFKVERQTWTPGPIPREELLLRTPGLPMNAWIRTPDCKPVRVTIRGDGQTVEMHRTTGSIALAIDAPPEILGRLNRMQWRLTPVPVAPLEALHRYDLKVLQPVTGLTQALDEATPARELLPGRYTLELELWWGASKRRWRPAIGEVVVSARSPGSASPPQVLTIPITEADLQRLFGGAPR